MNKFYKISLEQYIKDSNPELDDYPFENEWNDIKIPKRATSHSAGYDFYSPFSLYWQTEICHGSLYIKGKDFATLFFEFYILFGVL